MLHKILPPRAEYNVDQLRWKILIVFYFGSKLFRSEINDGLVSYFLHSIMFFFFIKYSRSRV